MLSEESLVQRLSALVGPEHVVAGAEVSGYAVDGKTPKAAAFPGSVEETSAVMTFASAEGLKVAPWGSGTKIPFGGIPERVDLVLGLRRLGEVVDYVPEDMTATFQAGTPLKDAQAVLGQKGQWIALDPPHAERATIGGVLATNSSGPRRLRYGSSRDFLIAISVVHADGKITKGGAKVVKNVTGYDMPKLYIGSLGTLGIIVDATFRVYPVFPVEKTYLAPFPTAEAEQQVLNKLLDSTVVPNAVELLNPDAARRTTAQAGLTWQEGSYGLAVAIGSVPEAVQAQIAAVERLCREGGSSQGHILEGTVHHTFWQAVGDFSLGDGHQAVLKASVLLTQVAQAVRMGEAVAAKAGLSLGIISEAGSGIVRYYLSGDRPDRFQQGLAEAVSTLRTFAQATGGSLVVLEAPPDVKGAVDVWGSVGNTFPLMQGLKDQFDPQRILNPGRFVGGL
ncbi:MAG: FAD-binding oxidoreductase [candidate division NC10 bacterium]|nr:FAD-binding oxidoreductase [candidate division NC10 bacterium]